MEAGTGWVVKTASLAVGAIRGDLPFDGVRRKARGLKATRDMHEGVIYGREGVFGGARRRVNRENRSGRTVALSAKPG